MAGKLLRINKYALMGASAFLVLTLAGHVGIREWYGADLRYEIGGYYRAQGTAIASLKLQNYGRSDASVAGCDRAVVCRRGADPIITGPCVTETSVSAGAGEREVGDSTQEEDVPLRKTASHHRAEPNASCAVDRKRHASNGERLVLRSRVREANGRPRGQDERGG